MKPLSVPISKRDFRIEGSEPLYLKYSHGQLDARHSRHSRPCASLIESSPTIVVAKCVAVRLSDLAGKNAVEHSMRGLIESEFVRGAVSTRCNRYR
jgi:hypothetical protein